MKKLLCVLLIALTLVPLAACGGEKDKVTAAADSADNQAPEASASQNSPQKRNRSLLNPKDLYNISKELGLAPRDTIAQYCEVYLGQNSRIPIVRLKPRESIKRCPLLRDRKCSVHNAKPTVCALFPLGRSIKLDAKETDPNAIERAGSSISSTPLSAEIVPKSIPYASG